MTYLAKNFGFCAYLICAEATPVSSILIESKFFFSKIIHLSFGKNNLERNPKSGPKNFSRLCTFKTWLGRGVQISCSRQAEAKSTRDNMSQYFYSQPSKKWFCCYLSSLPNNEDVLEMLFITIQEIKIPKTYNILIRILMIQQ